MTPEEFIQSLKIHSRSIQNRSGIPWQVILAQAALETQWLRAPVTDISTGRNSFNLFNIKGKGPAGSVKAYDLEYKVGRPRRVVAEFRAYNNYYESMTDYVELISRSKRYAPAMEVVDDPEEFARRLQECGYAADPRYAEKLIMIMRKYMKEEEFE